MLIRSPTQDLHGINEASCFSRLPEFNLVTWVCRYRPALTNPFNIFGKTAKLHGLQSRTSSSFLTVHAGLTKRALVKGNEDPGYEGAWSSNQASWSLISSWHLLLTEMSDSSVPYYVILCLGTMP